MKKVLSNTRLLCDGMKGQNYWFNGCMEYLMECLDEDLELYHYWFFSNITGDSLMQLYCKNIHTDTFCPSNNVFDQRFAKRAFDACGYDFTYLCGINDSNRNGYLPKIKQSIDRRIPVLCRGLAELGPEFCCICGYDGDDLLYLVCEKVRPVVYPNTFTELIFAGEKKERPSPGEVYRKTVLDIPSFLLRSTTEEYSFGKQAFIDWAESFQNGTFDGVPANEINVWNVHGTYLCMAGTNGCADHCLKNALQYNPDMTFIKDLLPLYEKQQLVFHDLAYRDANGRIDYQNGGMQGGFNIKPETIKNKELMKPISNKIMESAKICDEILEVFHRAGV